MKKILVFTLLLAVMAVRGQVFSGEIYLRDTSSLYLNQVYVTNLNEQKTVLSDMSGTFRISAKVGDIIRFTSIVTERKDVQVTNRMLNSGPIIVELRISYHEIEEVVVSNFKVSGNLKKDVLALKPGQKSQKIKDFIGLPEPVGDGTPPQLPVASLAGGGLSFSIDSIYDIVSGTRKKKERLQRYEAMMAGITGIKGYFGVEYFTRLKIPENLVDNFLQFVYSSDNLQPYVAAGNYEATKIYIEKYLPIYQRRLKDSKIMSVVLN